MATLLLIILYCVFISLGLPDSILGTCWPVMHIEFAVNEGLAGFFNATVSLCTIISSLLSQRLSAKFGIGKVVLVSVLLTAIGLLGGYFLSNIYLYFLLALPLGIGAGAIDTLLNDYVAKKYKAIHLNWLHCFWGIGAGCGTLLVGGYLKNNINWRYCYLTLACVQFLIVVILLFALPLWKKVEKCRKTYKNSTNLQEIDTQKENYISTTETNESDSTYSVEDNKDILSNTDEFTGTDKVLYSYSGDKVKEVQNFYGDSNDYQEKKDNLPNNSTSANDKTEIITIKEAIKTKGVIFSMLSFVFYCAMESVIFLWGSTYLVNIKNLDPATAANWVSIFMGGLIVGRFLNGILSLKIKDNTLIRMGICIVSLGVICLLIPYGYYLSLVGFILIGLGYAPIYPSLMHSTPIRFGERVSLRVVSLQSASTYVAFLLTPILFGYIGENTTFAILPYVILGLMACLIVTNEITEKNSIGKIKKK